nr:helix-turn-helix domain-containing protein [uncultured Lichenicoccus sp.]
MARWFLVVELYRRRLRIAARRTLKNPSGWRLGHGVRDLSHRFLVKEIALQAGVSEATVDRVLHRRGGVRAHTVRRVEQALRELDRQSAQLGLSGRKFIIDIVIEAPLRFTEAVRSALEAELPNLHPAVFRCRYETHETIGSAAMAAIL